MLVDVRIGMTIGGDVRGQPSSPPEIVAEARRAEDEGFATAWSVHFSRAYDALTTLAVAGTATARIDLGVGVVPTYPRHPLALAQQAATAQVFCGGRLTLGVGVSHRPVIENMHGLSLRQPGRAHAGVPLGAGPAGPRARRDFHGEHSNVSGGFTVPGTSPVSVVVAALSKRMVQVAGELADGIVTWLAGPRTLDGHRPGAARGRGCGAPAGAPGRSRPSRSRCTTTGTQPEKPRTVFARYGTLENYRASSSGKASARRSRDLAVVGSEQDVEKQLRRFAEAGATELWPASYPGRGRADASLPRAARALLAGPSPVTVALLAGADRCRLRRRDRRRPAAARLAQPRRHRARARAARTAASSRSRRRGGCSACCWTRQDTPVADFGYDPAHGEVYNCRERRFAAEIGHDAGWLHAGRPRREAVRIALRLRVRRDSLDADQGRGRVRRGRRQTRR